MENLLENPTWQADENGYPMYYAATGPITYDTFVVDGYRTCSITMPDGQTAMGGYIPYIDIQGVKNLQLGLEMRAIEITSLMFAVSFFNEDGGLIDTKRNEVGYLVTENFDDVFESFTVPDNATYARVDIAFMDRVTACTFYNPRVLAM